MCGIAGIVRVPGSAASGLDLGAIASQMGDAVQHRGPDDSGVWTDPNSGVSISHRRLSIVDLSSAGHQPMVSASGRYVLAFNGEIYNHVEIRTELQKEQATSAWKGHSDTETLLAGIEKWGLADTLTRTVGMFALAVWDRSERALHLARDRFGEKPLYFGWARSDRGHVFAFGSELKALLRVPGFQRDVCRNALAQLLQFNYIPAPLTIYQSAYKLEPGCVLTLNSEQPTSKPSCLPQAPFQENGISIRRWWSLSKSIECAAANQIRSEQEAVASVEAALQESVRLQSMADVPLGAFLSGGVDSALITALMQEHSNRPVNTFTIGFEESSFDEAPHAKAVARHLGTNHHEFRVTPSDALAVIPSLPRIYDEPFADSSQIPTHLVSKAARQHVTVALSGDAGDEMFGGYNRYLWAPEIWGYAARLPFWFRRLIGSGLLAVPQQRWDSIGGPVMSLLSADSKVSRLGSKLHKLGGRLANVRSLDDLYLSLVSEWASSGVVVGSDRTRGVDQLARLAQMLPSTGVHAGFERMMLWDSLTYLPDDILCKVDRASMATGLETRAPFLDHRIAEVSWRLPARFKVRNRQGKWVLRQILQKYIPDELMDRPKSGFAIPIGTWLTGPLKPWADDLLNPARLRADGYFDEGTVSTAWKAHQSGQSDMTYKLWSVLMFQAWRRES